MVFNNSILLGAAGQGGAASFDPTLIGNSVWFDGSADNLSRSTSSHSSTEVVMACWFQRTSFAGSSRGIMGLGTGSSGSTNSGIWFGSDDTLYFYNNGHGVVTNRLFRDIGWYHICASWKLDESIASNKGKLFINGEEVTSFSADPRSSWGTSFGSTATQTVGVIFTNTFFDGYITQAVMLDGQSMQGGDVAITDFVDTFTFGTNGSQVIPKKDSDIAALASAAGGNSFCLDFEDSSDLGNDISSNNNDLTPNSMSSANQSIHTPSRVYPTMNPLNDVATVVLSEGNTRVNAQASASIRSTAFASAGKRYAEITVTTVGNSYLGVAVNGTNPTSFAATGVVACQQDGDIYVSSSSPSGNKCPAYTTGDVMGILIDVDADKFWVSKNGTFHSMDRNPTITLTAEQVLAGTGGFDLTALGSDGSYGVHVGNSDGTSANVLVNFGQYSYTHTPPTGYINWASDNFDAPAFQGIDYFDATLYEGNGFNQRVGNFVPFTDTYTVDKSVFFDDGDRRYLAKTFDSGDPTATSTPGGSNSAKATISFWIKYNRSVGSGDQYIFSTANTAQTQRFTVYRNEQSAEDFFFINMNPGPKMFKAPVQSALLSEQEWSNVVINVDLDNSTGADKVKMFVNGVQITSVDTTYQSASNSNYFLFANEDHFIGNLAPASAGYTGFCLDSYLAEMHVIDGHVKAPTDFGQVDTATNRWVAKDYKTNVNTYGNRGFYMAFDNASGTSDGVGTDSSGNGFNFTESFVSGGSAWTSTDTVTDTPSKNFATLSSTRKSAGTLSEGNLSYDSGAASSVTLNCLATMPIPSSGKWAVKIINTTTGTNFGSVGVGYMGTTDTLVSASAVSTTGTHGVYFSGGTTRINGVSGPTLSTWKRPADGANPFVELFFDRDANTLKSKVNGGSLETITPTLTEKQITFALIAFAGSTGSQYEVDFGQKGYTPSESGFLTLNQDNLDDTASKITAWAWIKNRDADDNHMLFDRVRGVGKDLQLFASSTVAEATDASTLQRFLQRGVQVGNDAKVNTVNESYVLWQWLVGDSATTGTVIPADNPPSIASTVITADAGHFSVGTFTGAGGSSTIGHGLSAAPEFFLVKRIGTSGTGWFVYSKDTSDPNNKFLRLQGTNAEDSASGAWTPGAATMGLNESSLNGINTSGVEHLFIAFRSVPGVCKVGSYVGNNTDDNAYVSLGFTPRFFMCKMITGSSQWHLIDSARSPTNEGQIQSFANLNNAEQNSALGAYDLLSDAIKIRSDANFEPGNTGTWVYMAMADIAGNGRLPPIYGR